MALSSGFRLGPYQIVDLIGSGGMSEVYRAQDLRLNREVAIKVLHEPASGDAASVLRFERESRAVAAIDHPGILSVHDAGSALGRHYAVTELLRGESLADRLRSGPIAAARAVELVAQAAEGLAAAHARGIVHRDIKPGNLFLTADGRMKIMDFGIACMDEESPGGRLTGRLMIVGTAGYMSPEQVRGKRCDARSDVFSLGSVLYEMLTGRRAFSREVAVETMDAVLHDDPRAFPESAKIPETLRPIVFQCLEKDPADRYQTARDLALDLRAYQAGAIQEAASRVAFRTEPPWKYRRTRILLRSAAAVAIFLLGLLVGRGCH
jgi:serine/threonine protein kinase